MNKSMSPQAATKIVIMTDGKRQFYSDGTRSLVTPTFAIKKWVEQGSKQAN